MAPAHLFQSALALSDLELFYREVRHTSERLGEPLSDADSTVQSMPDASPAKWHLAHTTWFFEAMVLSPHLKGYRPFDERFTFLFNSYYETLGARLPRRRRGMITRPALEEVYAYRAHVDQAASGEGRHKGHAHFIDLGLVADVEGQRVRLSANASVAVTFEQEQSGKPV